LLNQPNKFMLVRPDIPMGVSDEAMHDASLVVTAVRDRVTFSVGMLNIVTSQGNSLIFSTQGMPQGPLSGLTRSSLIFEVVRRVR
jgi:hypothetical protein